MPIPLPSARLLLVLPTLASLSACAGQDTTRTGFISSYEGMAPTKGHTDDLIFVDPGYVSAAYRQVIIDPVAWQPAPDAPLRDPEVIAQLQADFLKSLTESLSKDFEVVAPPAPGTPARPGVLRVRSAITNTRKANWWINAPVQVAGIGLAIIGAPGLPPPNPGGASEELEVVDAASGKRLAAIATYNNGMPWQPLGFYQQYGHARRSFAKAADLLREQLKPPLVRQASAGS